MECRSTLESSAKMRAQDFHSAFLFHRPIYHREITDLILENTVKKRSQDLKLAFIFNLDITKLFVNTLC